MPGRCTVHFSFQFSVEAKKMMNSRRDTHGRDVVPIAALEIRRGPVPLCSAQVDKKVARQSVIRRRVAGRDRTRLPSLHAATTFELSFLVHEIRRESYRPWQRPWPYIEAVKP